MTKKNAVRIVSGNGRNVRSLTLLQSLMLTAATALALAPTATAQTFTWTPSTTDWDDGANWTPGGGPPGAGDNVNVSDPTTPAVIDFADEEITNLTVGDTTDGRINLRNGYSLFVNGDAQIGLNGGSGIIDVVGIPGFTSGIGASGNWTLGVGQMTLTDAVLLNLDSGFTLTVGNDVSRFANLDISGEGAGVAFETIIVGNNGNGHVDLRNGALLFANHIVLQGNNASTGSLNVGGDGSPEDPGFILANSIAFGPIGSLRFEHTSDDYFIDAELQSDSVGDGEIQLWAGTTYFTADSSTTFTGGTFIYGADTVLGVDAGLGGNIFVGRNFGFFGFAGGTLTGTGVVNNVSLALGGALAPGYGIGTMTVNGDLTFEPGTFFLVDVDADNHSDLVNVSGTTTIDGAHLLVHALPGEYGLHSQYLILNGLVGAPIVGQFADASVDNPFLSVAGYGNNGSEVILILQRVRFDTPNQTAVANALFNSSSTLTDELRFTDDQGEALDQLTGEVHADLAGLSLTELTQIFDLMRMRLTQMAGDAPRIQLASLAADVPMGAAPGKTFWTQAFGAWGDREGDGNSAELDYSRSGIVLGGDLGVGDASRLGVAVSWAQTEADVDARNSSADIDTLGVNLYGATTFGPFEAAGSIGYAWRNIDTERHVVFGFVDETLTASYESKGLNVQGELSYPMELSDITLAPFAGLSYVSLDTEGFTETGGTAAEIVDASENDITSTLLGLRATKTFKEAGGLVGSIGWRHVSGDVTPTMRAAFTTDPGVAFNVSGAPLAEDAFALEAGYGLTLSPGLQLSAAYHGELADEASEHSISLRLAWRH